MVVVAFDRNFVVCHFLIDFEIGASGHNSVAYLAMENKVYCIVHSGSVLFEESCTYYLNSNPSYFEVGMTFAVADSVDASG